MDLMQKEYETIRTEMRENKTFIFERAVIAVIGIFALLNYTAEPISFILPTVAIIIIMYLMLFISNRFKSSAHMAAFILQFHEGELKNKWFGWEQYLDKFRKFGTEVDSKVENAININCKINEEFEKVVKSKYLFNYHRIYKFHKCLIWGFIILSIYYLSFYIYNLIFKNAEMDYFILVTQIFFIIFNFGLTFWFFKKHKDEINPNIIVTRIEYYKIVCKELLNY